MTLVALACASLLASCEDRVLQGSALPTISFPSEIAFDFSDDIRPYVFYYDGTPDNLEDPLQMRLPMIKGTNVTLGYTVTPDPSELDFPEMQWVSDDPSIVTVDMNGNIAAVAAGSTFVRVRPVAPNMMNASINIVVVETAVPVTSIEIADSAQHFVEVDGVEYPSIYVTETMPLTATVSPTEATFKSVKWSSSDTGIATVDLVTGVVTGVSIGKVTITATALDATSPVSQTHDIFIDDIIDPIGIRLTNAPAAGSRTALNVRNFTLNYQTYPVVSTASLITWTTSDANVATVENGVVSLKAPGTVTITAICSDSESPIPGEFAGYEHSASATFNIPAGYIYEHFTDPASSWWVPKTAGTSMERKHNATTGEYYMEIIPNKNDAQTLRGDNGTIIPVWLNRSAYPIICIRIDDVQDVYGYTRNFNLDTSGDVAGARFSGNFGGSNNKWKTKYKCSDGSAILIYDLSTQSFATGGVMPENVSGQFGTFQFKYADIRKNPRVDFEPGENGMFRFFWIETFESEAVMTTYLNQWSTATGITFAP